MREREREKWRMSGWTAYRKRESGLTEVYGRQRDRKDKNKGKGRINRLKIYLGCFERDF